jgi:hypothetical protein
MANEFAMEPEMSNFPDLVREFGSQLNEWSARLGPRGGSAIDKGDLNPVWEKWDLWRELAESEAPWFGSLADGSGGAGAALRASDQG